MRSYGQFCAMAKALDLVGDRWTLLIVRELLMRGPSRYTDLRQGLPGIATNLLAQRLEDLENADILRREYAPPPVATTLIELTPRGMELEPVLFELGKWGVPLLAKPAKNDAFSSHWLALPAKHLLRDHTPDGPPVTLEIRSGGEPLTIEVSGGNLNFRTGPAKKPDLVLNGTPLLMLGVLTGKRTFADARAAGLKYEGDPKILRRLQPPVQSQR